MARQLLPRDWARRRLLPQHPPHRLPAASAVEALLAAGLLGRVHRGTPGTPVVLWNGHRYFGEFWQVCGKFTQTRNLHLLYFSF